MVQQLLLNYLPTSIATLIEPFWVVLNRLLCILVPFDELRRGNATPQTSLTLKYTNLPPQLVLWRALGARHFLLTAVCSVALLANVLTIALSGLFSQYFVYLSDDILLNHLHLSSTQANNTWLKGGIVIDQFYVASSNITANTTLPAWVTPTHFFLPFELPQSADMAARYAANTTAVGAELECREMNSTLSKSFYNFTLNHDATKMNISTYHHQPDGDIFRCFAGLDVQGPPQGIRALEIFAGLGPINSDAPESAFCTSLLVGGWIRSNITLSPKPNTADKWPTFNTTSVDTDQMFMVCQPQLKHSSFEVTVDSLGTILDARSTVANSSITNVTDLFSLSNTLVNAVTTFRSPTWHNDSLAGDWTNYLIQKRINSRAILDPHAPVPLFAPTAALFSEIYTRTFAILLSLNTAWLPKSPLFESTPIPAKVITGHWRVFMNPTMFILAITILSLDLVVAVWLYTAHPKPFLPRMPTSLASVIAFFAAGNVLQDLKRDDGSEGHGCGVEGQIKHLESKRWRFGYGKLFAGSDGVSRVGIERVPFFMPLDQEPEEKERGIDVKKRFRGLWRRKHVRGRGRGFEDL